jgi:hypothetical protein
MLLFTHELADRVPRQGAGCAPQEHHGMAIDSDASNRCEEALRSSDALGASGNGSSPGSRGPALGYPIVRGSCVVALPADDEGLFKFAMHLVLNNDYHGLMELARRGRADVLVTQRCGFTLHCLSSENESASSQQALRLRGATILHYAVCVRSLRAASALSHRPASGQPVMSRRTRSGPCQRIPREEDVDHARPAAPAVQRVRWWRPSERFAGG